MPRIFVFIWDNDDDVDDDGIVSIVCGFATFTQNQNIIRDVARAAYITFQCIVCTYREIVVCCMAPRAVCEPAEKFVSCSVDVEYGMGAHCCLLWYRRLDYFTHNQCSLCVLCEYCIHNTLSRRYVWMLVHSSVMLSLPFFCFFFVWFLSHLSTADELCVHTVYFPLFFCCSHSWALLCFAFRMLSCAIKSTIKLSTNRDQLILYSTFVCCCNCSLNQVGLHETWPKSILPRKTVFRILDSVWWYSAHQSQVVFYVSIEWALVKSLCVCACENCWAFRSIFSHISLKRRNTHRQRSQQTKRA